MDRHGLRDDCVKLGRRPAAQVRSEGQYKALSPVSYIRLRTANREFVL